MKNTIFGYNYFSYDTGALQIISFLLEKPDRTSYCEITVGARLPAVDARPYAGIDQQGFAHVVYSTCST